jgi:hypothetical protein
MDRNCDKIAFDTANRNLWDSILASVQQLAGKRGGLVQIRAGGRSLGSYPKRSASLRTRLAEVKPDDPAGQTFAEVVAANLIEIACTEGPGSVHAASEIADRLEGRSRQSIEVADITAELRNKSDEELRFHLAHGRWPTDEELVLLRQSAEPTEM